MNDLIITSNVKFEDMISSSEFTGLREKTDYLIKTNVDNVVGIHNKLKKILQEKKIECRLNVGEKYLLLESGITGGGDILQRTAREIVEFYF